MKTRYSFQHSFWTLLSLLLTVIIAVAVFIAYLQLQLADTNILLTNPPLEEPLKIYTADDKLIAEFGPERRTPIPFDQIPKPLVDAVLATEDQRFFEHAGIDPMGLMRAAFELITTGKKVQGGSTITMQVARNFFLNSEKTYSRKIKEILLAIKIEHELSKDKILELYLNKIYFGNRAYGVAAASEVYFGRPLNQLTIAELATLAGIPKAPSTLNPIADPTAAKERRDHVLTRMYERGYIDKKTYQSAIVEPISASYHGQFVQSRAQYVGEMVRDAMYAHFGEETYTKGYKVYTTLNSQLQKDANHALRGALLAYDQRHGYRGPSGDLHGNPTSSSVLTKWQDELEDIPEVGGLESAAVTTVNGHSVLALLGDGKTIEIPWHGLEWARRVYKDGAFGRTPSEASDILHVGNIIRVIKMADGSYRLAQIPEVEGAFVAVNPQDGAIMALVGGFDFSKSKYNRVTQSLRQPGSGFKPFVYAAALDRGFTLASLINDNPIEINDPATHSVWRPQNDTRQYYGPTRLRVCLSKSRNLASVHLLQDIGMGYALRYTTRFGFERSQIPRNLTMVLGTGVVSPLQMAAGYAVFANGGYKINPYIIARIDDAGNHTLYQSKPRLACSTCIVGTTVPTLVANTQPQAYPATPVNRTAIVPSIPVVQQAPQVISPQIAFLMNTALQDVIRHGTGRGAMILNRNDLAGKTGTTQEMRDAWFSGYNGDIVATAWVGYDNDPRSLDEHGAQAALPMWINFMQRFLQGRPEHAMPQPPGIVTAAIDPNTGKLAGEGEPGAIPEVFLVNHLPGDGGPTDNPNPGDVELSAPVL